jgi:prepilin-type N-terminal cleavage/methylation domain-containing protein
MMTAPKDRTARNFHCYAGFTLTELLVVIGVIAILIGVLLPVIGRVRMAAYKADTLNEFSQITSACSAYYSTYHSYPGPFSNFQTQWGGGNPASGTNNGTAGENTGGSPVLVSGYANGAPVALTTLSPSNATYYVTGSENLVLGLMGGLRFWRQDPTGNFNDIAFAPSEVGLGPMSLNPLNPSRQPAFFPTGSNYLMWCQQPNGGGAVYQSPIYNSNDNLVAFTDPSNNQGSDSPIPEFVDRFPQPGPLPILYLRARTGAKGVVSDGGSVVDPVANAAAQYQYDIRDIVNYTDPAANTGASASPGCTLAPIGLQNLNMTPNNIHNLPRVVAPSVGWIVPNTGSPLPPAGPGIPPIPRYGPQNPKPGPQQTTNLNVAFSYFCNASIAPTNTATAQFINYSAKPRAVDQFILISAGPDGIYGTSDDITSFGDVSQ